MDVLARSREQRMLKKYSHYQGYKWGLLLLGFVSLLFGPSAPLHGVLLSYSGMSHALFLILCMVGACLFHEKMQSVKTMQRYRERIEALLAEQKARE